MENEALRSSDVSKPKKSKQNKKPAAKSPDETLFKPIPLDPMSCYVACPPGDYRDSFITEDSSSLIKQLGPLTLNDSDHYLDASEITGKLRNTEVLFTLPENPPITEKYLKAMPKLRLIVHTGDSAAPLITIAALRECVDVLCAGRIIARITAEAIITYISMLLRGVHEYGWDLARGGWGDDIPSRSLFRKKIGIIGCGYCGMYLALMLKRCYKCELYAWDPILKPDVVKRIGAECASPEEIFAGCDAISVNLSNNPSTAGFVNAQRLALMRDGSVLVCTSHGIVTDENALIAELKTGRIAAALDVFSHEPMAPDNPLRNMPNAVVTPHIAGIPTDMREYIFSEMVNEAVLWKLGKPTTMEITLEHYLGMTGNRLANLFL